MSRDPGGALKANQRGVRPCGVPGAGGTELTAKAKKKESARFRWMISRITGEGSSRRQPNPGAWPENFFALGRGSQDVRKRLESPPKEGCAVCIVNQNFPQIFSRGKA